MPINRFIEMAFNIYSTSWDDGLTNRFSYHLVMLFQDPQAQAVWQFLVIILHSQHRIVSVSNGFFVFGAPCP